jgi:hypothetical protein
MTRLEEKYRDRPWWPRDVPGLLQAVSKRVRFDADDNVLVATDLDQKVVDASLLEPHVATYETRSAFAYGVLAPDLERMLPMRGPGEPAVGVGFVIRARFGRVVPSIEDAEWERALLYATGSICCFVGGLIVVTQHGWRFADMAGWTPTLDEIVQRRLRAV